MVSFACKMQREAAAGVKLMLDVLKFLPSSCEEFSFTFDENTSVDAANSEAISKKVPILGIPVWTSGSSRNGFWVRLNEFHKFGVLPKAHIKNVEKGDSRTTVTGEMKFFGLSKLFLRIWIMFCLITYPIIVFVVYKNAGDTGGTVEVLVNGTPTDVRVTPTIAGFIGLHFVGFFLYPATIVSLGWGKTKKLLPAMISRRLDDHGVN